jgi:hypothetical protein
MCIVLPLTSNKLMWNGVFRGVCRVQDMFFAVAHPFFVFVFISAGTNPVLTGVISGTDITMCKS